MFLWEIEGRILFEGKEYTCGSKKKSVSSSSVNFEDRIKCKECRYNID